jgi:hypothetical protein
VTRGDGRAQRLSDKNLYRILPLVSLTFSPAATYVTHNLLLRSCRFEKIHFGRREVFDDPVPQRAAATKPAENTRHSAPRAAHQGGKLRGVQATRM